MNCQRFETVVNDIAREQIIDAAARAEALTHIYDCRSCAGRLADERTITKHLRDLAQSTESAGPAARVEARLLAAFNENLTQFRAPLTSIGQSRRRYWAMAIAAGFLLVFGLAGISWRQAQPANQPPAATLVADVRSAFSINTRSPLPAAPELHQSATTGFRDRRSPQAKRPATPRNRPDNASNTEIATDFLPLSYGSTVNLQDGGQMVRVELPRSAMASFGLPVNMDRANEKVKADVLLGVDGLAHAIRFVR